MTEIEEPPVPLDECLGSDFGSVPGGAYIDQPAVGTTACKYIDSSNESKQYMLTCAHVVEESMI